jgi:hypothetical protein
VGKEVKAVQVVVEAVAEAVLPVEVKEVLPVLLVEVEVLPVGVEVLPVEVEEVLLVLLELKVKNDGVLTLALQSSSLLGFSKVTRDIFDGNI